MSDQRGEGEEVAGDGRCGRRRGRGEDMGWNHDVENRPSKGGAGRRIRETGMTTYGWQDPGWLGLLLLWPAAWWWRRRRAATVWVVPFAARWARPAGRGAVDWATWAMAAGGVLLTVALARPQRVTEARHEAARGHDVMLVLAVPTSMLTCDYRRGARRYPGRRRRRWRADCC